MQPASLQKNCNSTKNKPKFTGKPHDYQHWYNAIGMH